MRLKLIMVSALIVVACKKKTESTTPPPPPAPQPEQVKEAPPPTAPVTPAVNPNLPPASGTGNAISPDVLVPPATPRLLSESQLDLQMEEIDRLISSNDVKLSPLATSVSYTPSALEKRLITCTNEYLSNVKFQGAGNSFTLINPPNIDQCMSSGVPPPGADSEYKYSLSFALKGACNAFDFSSLSGKSITDTVFKNGFCRTASAGSLLFNVVAEASELSGGVVTRKMKRVKALQGKGGSDCAFIVKDKRREYSECAWVDRTDGKDANIHFAGAAFVGVKGGFSGEDITYTSGKMDIQLDDWRGELSFDPPTQAPWSMDSGTTKKMGAFSYGVTEDIVDSSTAPTSGVAPVGFQTVTPSSQIIFNCPTKITGTTAVSGATDITQIKTLPFDNETFVTGTVVTNGQKDAYAARVKADKSLLWCKLYSVSAVDEMGSFVTSVAGKLYLAIAASGNASDGLNATAGAWQTSYGSGDSKRTSWIAQIDPATGRIVNASWLSSRGSAATIDWTQAGYRNAGPVQSLDIESIAQGDNNNIDIAALASGYAPGCAQSSGSIQRSLVVTLSADLKRWIQTETCP